MKVSSLFFLFLLSAANLFGLTPWQTFLNEVKAKAESGDADSQGILSALVRTDAISGSAEDAFSLAEKAAIKSPGFGSYALGMCHLYGVGTIQNKEKANDLLAKALPPLQQLRDAGNPTACVIVGGVHLLRGLAGDSKDEAEAVKWFRLAADQGFAWAQANLGVCYFNGTGVSKDEAEAVKWFRLAADQGFAEAQANLGVCYINGTGVSKDDTEAVKWFRLAADQGFAWVQANLGKFYFNGTGVSKDEAEGVKWSRLAADQGFAEAQSDLGACYLQGTGVSKDEVEGVKWIRLAADQGNLYAQRILGICYQFGKGVSKDDTEAVKWFRLAADQADVRAKSLLAHMQTTENNVSKSEDVKAQTLVVKGFYLGMTIDAACENANKKLNAEIAKICQPLMVTQNTDGTFILVPSRDSQGILVPDIKTDTNGVVIGMVFKNKVSDILFNSADMNDQEFTQTFMEAYNIPEMQDIVEEDVFGNIQRSKRYNSPLGYALLMFSNHTFALMGIPKKTERKFGD